MMTADDENDRAALQLAFDLTRAEPERAEQIAAMLAQPRPWREVAEFCSYHRQNRALRLKPWESPPCWIADADDELARPEKSGSGRHQAAKLVKQMDALGVSRFHPDPLAAIEEAKALQAAADATKGSN